MISTSTQIVPKPTKVDHFFIVFSKFANHKCLDQNKSDSNEELKFFNITDKRSSTPYQSWTYNELHLLTNTMVLNCTNRLIHIA
ncbi:hypothetical protein C1H46_034714 [Malus baccata]|uniref:Uncharacterized protein n=1 Tax=Malus baccata TaxID=106549 RepID=A0A540KZT4_MALBA|nr:hypothetical protein C1H46_034714 [Malus baccata]